MSNGLIMSQVFDETIKNGMNLPEEYTDTILPFRPVKCTESALKNITPVPGYVYFATDTQKIFYGDKGKFISMGGNSGFYYGNKTFTDPADLSFSINDIDGDKLPNIGDLIINVGDNVDRNGFYRVIDFLSNTEVNTSYLPVGGGGSGSSAGSGGGKILITPLTSLTGTVVKGRKYEIGYSLEIYDNNNNPVLTSGTATWNINGTRIDGGFVKHNGVYTGFDVSPYLSSNVLSNSITLTISINTGGIVNQQQTLTWSVQAIDLYLIWNWKTTDFISEDSFTTEIVPYGNVDCKLWYSINDGRDLNENYFYVDILKSETGKLFPLTLPGQSYGAFKFTMWLEANINGTLEKSIEVSNTVIFTRGGTTPIIAINYFEKTARQYDLITIPFVVYDPSNPEPLVEYYVNDNFVTDKNCDRTTIHEWTYLIGVSGEVTLSLKCGDYSEESITLTVAPLELDIKEPTVGLQFNLRANEFSGNTDLQEWQNNGVTLDFEGFDWVNDGLQYELDEKGNTRKYICVKRGRRMYVKYPLFNSSNTNRSGKVFKFCFKATNCYDYEAEVLNCYEESTKLGIKVDAQKAVFSTLSVPNLDTQYCEDSYIELEAEIWPDVEDVSEKIKGERFLMWWVDGIPTGVAVYSHNEQFKHRNSNNYIVIGSDECDVYVYSMKVYERRLNEEEHINNFILDAPTTEDMLDRYERNNILENGEISYSRLVEKNPGCRAYLYDIDHMTTGTDDETDGVSGCSYYELLNEYNSLNKPYYRGEDVFIYAQGTSSAAYGVAGYNLRSKFEGKLYDASGNEVEGWKVSENALPIDLACTKVNVASCENANNALNQEWYNKFQPYWDGHRRRGYKLYGDKNPYRDCMEFNFGVVFIKDNNKNYDYSTETNYKNSNVFADDEKYMNSPYFKQYAIANMGNDKKNIQVFHDIENPLACCVEVANNNTVKQFMNEIIDINEFDTKENFEFRYPKKEQVTLNMKQGFVRLVNWMANNNPGAANESHILTAEIAQITANDYESNTYFIYDPVTDVYKIDSNDIFDNSKIYYNIIPAEIGNGVTVEFDTYTFKGFLPPKYENGIYKGVWDEASGSPMKVSLAGFSTSEYKGSYTHDSYKYRMAKMLQSCENYLVIDSIMYHYLFIQRHTMVDNVAKNTFWSSEDLLHWDLTKNYDNDTSDGNNNSGYLTHSYGIEILDKNNVFNAPSTTWLVFMHGLNEAQKKLFSSLFGENKSAWDSKSYLELFIKKQSLIPERCWVTDYFRKYIRPYILGLRQDFLERLEGGKKIHQRKQFETYQDFYLCSKYIAGDHFKETGAIDMRLNSDPSKQIAWSKDLEMTIQTYIDMYPVGLIGATKGNEWQGQRLSRGTIGKIPVGKLLDDPKDGTCYLYGAAMIQSLGGISSVYPTYATLTPATKLRSIEIGSDSSNYFNSNFTGANLNTNTMLENIQMQKVGVPAGIDKEKLELQNLKFLKELKIDGSTHTGLSLADSGIIETLWINPLGSLSMKNLEKLVSFKMDPNIYNTMLSLEIHNCPIMNSDCYISTTLYIPNNTIYYYYQSNIYTPISITNDEEFIRYKDIYNELYIKSPNYGYDLVFKSTNLLYYSLRQMDWIIKDDADVDIENDSIVGIKILDKLINNCSPIYNDTTLDLTGKITIQLSTAYSVNEFNIYNKYHRIFPNLTISYAGAVVVTPAIKITFYKNDLPNADILYEVLTNDGGYSLSYLTSKDGPSGQDITTPIKEQDQYYTYHWNLNEAPELYEEDEWLPYDWTIDGIHKTHEEVMNMYPNKNLEIRPYFTRVPRLYTVTLKNVIDKVEHIVDTKKVKYGTIISLPDFIYKENTKEHYRYEFNGWISALDYMNGNKNPVIYPFNYQIVNNFTAYTYFTEEDCRITPSNLKYFDIENMSSGHNACGISMYGNLGISIKNEYKDVLQGKITLPSANINGTKIKCIVDFKGAKKITDVYFLKDAEYISIIDDWGFGRTSKDPPSNLQHIYLPNTIKYIGHKAFQSNLELLTIGPLENPIQLPSSLLIIGSNSLGGNFEEPMKAMKLSINELPDSIEKIGSNAFYWGVPNVVITKVPPNLTTIEQYAFHMCDSVGFDDIGYSNKLESLGANCLNDSGLGFWEAKKDTIDTNKIIIGKSVRLSENAFKYYKGIEYATFCFLGSPTDYGYNTSEEAATALGLGAGRYVFSYDPSVT